MVTGTTSPSTRYERISVSPASCSIKSEYVIASHAFKPQYKCINYTPTWEQRKLGELSSEFQSGDFISAEKILASGPYPVYGGNGLRGYAKRYNHDGFYALIGRQGALCGNVNTAVGKAYFTEHAVAIKANSLHDTRFLVHLLRCMDLGQYSGQSAQPGLAVGVLKEVETTVPSKVEQQAIGSFFSRLDNLITLHQRKYDKLVVFKKSMLEKMFPKDGESVPEIRFAGFTDPWEQRKLGELEKDATLYMGRGRVISAKDMSNTPGTFPVYSSSALDNGRMGAYGKYMFNQELITWSIDGGGAVFYRRKHRFSVTNVSGYIAVNPEKINCKFLAYAMSLAHSRIKFDYTVKAHPSVIRSLYTMGIPISLQEQQVIGSFFSRLDNLITLHQRKLELLQNIKKSLLDKMFV